MKLYEIEPQKTVTITAKNPEEVSVNYKTKTVFGMNEMLFAEPVKQEEAVLDFSGKKLSISITYAKEDGTVLEWKKCAVKNVRYQKVRYMVLYSAEDGKKVNRRDAYRHFLAYDGVLHFGKNRKERKVTVRDISVMGVGIIMEEEHEVQDLGLLNLEFHDEEFNMPLQLYAKPVRKEKLDENRTTYGCRIVQSDANIGRYIAAKQKSEACRVHGTNFDYGKFFDNKK